MSERKEGWYWVRLPGEWVSAEWVGDPYYMWMIRGVDYEISEVGEIGPRIPTPEDPWQCVPIHATNGMIGASGHDHRQSAIYTWDAMLKAAPKP